MNFRQVLLQLIDLLLKVLHLLIFSAARSVKPRVQLHQVHIARLALREEDDARRLFGPLARLGLEELQINLTADDRLHTRLDRALGELERTEHIVGVGHRNRRHSRLGRQLRQLLDRNRPLEKRIFGMDPEMDKAWRGRHGLRLDQRRRARKGQVGGLGLEALFAPGQGFVGKF